MSREQLVATLLNEPQFRTRLDLPVAQLRISHLDRRARMSLELFMARKGVAIVRDLLDAPLDMDDLRALVQAIVDTPVPSTDPSATPAEGSDLPLHPTIDQLEAWAMAHHVFEALDTPVSEFIYRMSGRSRARPVHLDFFSIRQILALDTTQWGTRIPDDLRRDTHAHLLAVAAQVQRVLDEEARLAPQRATPPGAPVLRTLWEQLTQLRAILRQDGPPPERIAQNRLTFVEEPTGLRAALNRTMAIVLPLRPPLPVQQLLDTGHDDLIFQLCDEALDLLTDPARHATRDRLAALLTAPVWERDLAWLDRATVHNADQDDKNVLVWRVDIDRYGGLEVVCHRGRLNKRGDGYTCRRVNLHDLPPALRGDPADERVYDLLHGQTRQGPNHLLAVRALVGHPRVLGPGRGSKPVPVRLVSFVLHLQETDDGSMTLVPRLDGVELETDTLLERIRGQAGGGLYVHWTGEQVQVAPLRDTAVQFLRSWHQRKPRLPREALPEVLRRLPTWMAHAPISLSPSLHGTPVDNDPRPVVRLDGGDGLRVSVRVRPLPGGPVEEPGSGATELYDLRGSRVVHVARDLDEEAHAVEEAVDVLGLPASARTQPWDWWVRDPQVALGVVKALREHATDFQVEHTGSVPTLRRTARAADLKLTVREGRDWFGLSGGATIDGLDVDLDALIDAAVDGHRFVQLSDGSWVGLEAAFAERLAAAGSTPGGKQGRQLGALQAPAIAALADDGAIVEAPDAWLTLADRARQAQQLDPALPEGLHATLRPYQLQGFRWLAALAHWAPGACLADDMGLGKTVQTIALLLHRAAEGPALVVGPTTLVFNWERELSRFAPSLRPVTYHGADRAGRLDDLGPGDVLLTSYGVLVRDAEALAQVRFGTLVLDEAQAIKTPESLRARAARAVQADFRLALSGTPVENHLGDLWSLMAFVAPGLLGPAAWFRERFVLPVEGAGDTRRRALLGRLVRPFMLRRTKAAVAPDLPSRTEIVTTVTLSDEERRLYDALRRSALLRLSDTPEGATKRFAVLAELGRLRQLACHPRLIDAGSPVPSSKLKAAVRLLEDLRANGHRALVFSSFVRHLELVREALEARGFTLCQLDGSTSQPQRRAAVDAFQDGKADVFLISLKAGGTGLNLTAATYVLHLDPWWNPAAEDQATDRAHRIGQTQAVTVYRLVAQGTIEEQIVALHGHKRELAEAILSGADEAVVANTDDLVALLAEANLDLTPTDDDGDDPIPPPSAPLRAPAADVPALLARYEAELATQLTDGRLERDATARCYLNAVTHLLDWAGPDADLSRDAVARLAESYLAAVTAGRVPHLSDKVFGPPAFAILTAVAAR